MVIVLVLLLHALLIQMLITGLAQRVVEVFRKPLEAKLIEEMKPPPVEKPPLPQPRKTAMPPPPSYVPPPEVQTQVPAVQQDTITVVTSAPAPPALPAEPRAPAPGPAVTHTQAGIDHIGCAKPAYPPASLAAQEAGTVILKYLIDVDGSVLESKIETSSGFRRLDDAARRALAKCRFRPAMANGKAEQGWARIEYEWRLE